jgi:hypothetical protein
MTALAPGSHRFGDVSAEADTTIGDDWNAGSLAALDAL